MTQEVSSITQAKVLASIIAGAGAMFMLAFCSEAAGTAENSHQTSFLLRNTDDHYQDSNNARTGGFGKKFPNSSSRNNLVHSFLFS